MDSGTPPGDGDGDSVVDSGMMMDSSVSDMDTGMPQPSLRIEAEAYDDSSGNVGTEDCTDTGGGKNVMDVGNGEWLAFNNITFDGVTAFKMRTASANHPGSFELHKNSAAGTLLATCAPPVTGGWQNWTTVSCDMVPTSGTGTLYVVFVGQDENGGQMPNMNWLEPIFDAGQVVPARVQAESFVGTNGVLTEACGDDGGGDNVKDVGADEWMALDDFNFNGVDAFDARVASGGHPDTMEFRKGSPTGELLATCAASATGGWQNWQTVSCAGALTSGTGVLYIVFRGQQDNGANLPNVNWIESFANVVVDAGTETDAGNPTLDAGSDSDAGSTADAGNPTPDAGNPGPVPFIRYAFDETTGDAIADSAGTNNAAITGGHAWNAGKLGNALHFGDGSSGYAMLPAGVFSDVTDFTIATWVNLENRPQWSRIWDFGNNTENYFFLSPENGQNNKMRFEIKVNNNNQLVDAPALATGSWQHVAVTHKGNELSIYVNGVLAGFSGSVSHTPSELGATTNNGLNKSQYPDPQWNGSLDEFLFYKEALTAEEIQVLAGATPATPTPATLLFGYHFDENTGTAVADYSGNGKDGSLSGATSWTAGWTHSGASLDNPDAELGQVDMPQGAINSLSDFSMSLWVKEKAAHDWAQLIDFGSDNGHYIALIPRTGDGAHTMRLTFKNGGDEQTADAPGELPVGAWTHVAFTRSGTQVRLYVNGKLAGYNASVDIAPSALPNTTKNALGFSQWGDHHFEGIVDEFNVYSGVLSDAQIAAQAATPQTP
jgi:hypothetical protein